MRSKTTAKVKRSLMAIMEAFLAAAFLEAAILAAAFLEAAFLEAAFPEERMQKRRTRSKRTPQTISLPVSTAFSVSHSDFHLFEQDSSTYVVHFGPVVLQERRM